VFPIGYETLVIVKAPGRKLPVRSIGAPGKGRPAILYSAWSVAQKAASLVLPNVHNRHLNPMVSWPKGGEREDLEARILALGIIFEPDDLSSATEVSRSDRVVVGDDDLADAQDCGSSKCSGAG